MAELKIGSTLQCGKYEITKVLGSGNFGITYLATTKIAVNGQLGQMEVSANVAIKEFYMKDLNNRTLDGSTVEGTQNTMVKNYRQKFKKEAENLAKLHHPNIVKVIEVFDENNTTYYVMEYVEGGSLDDYIKSKGRLTEEEALQCTLEIGKTLSYMHENRMIHLDLKPKNIMRDKKGHLYLIDFGLSKQYDENGEPESSTSIGLGTPGYAPLEQASYKQDGTIPVTLDIYALGASLFKMLTGKTPPEASSILNEGLPLVSLKQIAVNADTISIVEKAMSPIKTKRYQSVDYLINDVSKNITLENDEATIMEPTFFNDKKTDLVPNSILRANNSNLSLCDDSISKFAIVTWGVALFMSISFFLLWIYLIITSADSLGMLEILVGTVSGVSSTGLILMMFKKIGGVIIAITSLIVVLCIFVCYSDIVPMYYYLLWTICLLFFAVSLSLRKGNTSAWNVIYRRNRISLPSIVIWNFGLFISMGVFFLTLSEICIRNGIMFDTLFPFLISCIMYVGLVSMISENIKGLVAVIISVFLVYLLLFYEVPYVHVVHFLWTFCVLVFVGSLFFKKDNMTTLRILRNIKKTI